jgi:FkbH-like protein
MNIEKPCSPVPDLGSALQIAATGSNREGDLFSAAVVAGFTPVHVTPFLAAGLTNRLPKRRIDVKAIGYWGQLPQNLNLAEQQQFHATAVCVEWDDLDPRLGSRSCTTQSAGDPDVLRSAAQQAAKIRDCLKRLARNRPVALSLPHLPLLPLSGPPRRFANSLHLKLQQLIHETAVELADLPLLRIVNPEFLQSFSPIDQRRDLKAEFRWGSPYSTKHIAVLCDAIAELLAPQPQCKGLITDLDNTLWKGIVGDVGVDHISWELQTGGQIHAVYQRMLASLASQGTLLAVASKNDPAVVSSALQRQDLIVPASSLFPVLAGWGPKSVAVQQILSQWNVAPDSVVFVDDSPLEIAEVAHAFPDIKCLHFPSCPNGVLETVLLPLREMFGKLSIESDDLLRATSIRETAAREAAAASTDPDEFLRSVKPELTIVWNQPDHRSFELVNKTNQFNLNGRRVDEAQWLNRIQDPGSLLLTVAYSDRFGPLGKVAVVAGRVSTETTKIDAWVLSCRAFGRRIEYQILALLFAQIDKYGLDVLELDFVETDRNGPLQDFLRSIGLELHQKPIRLSKMAFEQVCPEIPFVVLTS